jgi:PAS domain S-box-containing protein
MKRSQIGRFGYLVAQLIPGTAALALATWGCFRLGLGAAAGACVYLAVNALLSLIGTFVSCLIFSFLAASLLDFFFQMPLFTLQVAGIEDLTALAAFLITSIVITSLVRRLRRLDQTHRDQARLLDLTSDSVLVRDLKHVITFWNRGSEELYGWKKEEAVGKVSLELLQPIFPAPLEQITDELFRSGQWEGELFKIKRDGTHVTVASRWSVQLGEDGQPIGILETSNDITARKRAEDALRRIQETYLAEAQQVSLTGSFGWNVSSGEIFCSEEGLRIFGFDFKARPSMEMMLARVHPDDLTLVQRSIDRAAQDRQDFDFEHRLRLPDGTVKHVRIVARTTRSEAANVDFVGAVMDVTSSRLAELELQNTRTELAQVMRVSSLGVLTASIAHQVNQPLGAVVANAEACLAWLDRESPDLNEAQTAIKSIVKDSHRAAEIIRGLYALIKNTNPPMVLLDINEIVSESMNIVAHELRRYRVSRRMEFSSDRLVVFGHRIQLQQVLLILIINSMEAMNEVVGRERELVIQLKQEETRQVLVSVTDSGVGLPTENAQRIFDAFVTTKSSGIGMGLSICRSIIQAHGGRIWASPNEPHGATVQFTLPLHWPEAP